MTRGEAARGDRARTPAPRRARSQQGRACERRDLPEGRYVVVTRHPKAGREIRAFGGAARFRGKDVLDIGTGNGRLSFDVAPYARRVVGVDPSEAGIEDARDRAARLGLRNIEFRLGDAAELDVGRGRFDVAIFSWSL